MMDVRLAYDSGPIASAGIPNRKMVLGRWMTVDLGLFEKGSIVISMVYWLLIGGPVGEGLEGLHFRHAVQQGYRKVFRNRGRARV